MEANREPYTEEQLKRALDFLDERLSLERGFSSSLNAIFYSAALKILEVCKKYSVNPRNFKFSSSKRMNAEVDEIVAQMADAIDDSALRYAIGSEMYEEEDCNILRFYFRKERFGKTFEQRNNAYCELFKSEMEPIVAASSYLGIGAKETANLLKECFDKPHSSPVVSQAVKKGLSALKVESHTAYQKVERAGRDAIARARQDYFTTIEREYHNTNAWYVRRCSSYPCSLCDMQSGIHNSDFDLPPYHPNCCCIAIPIQYE